MVVTCFIEFDNNPFGTYFAGQMLSGKVTLNANKPKKVKAVALKITGFAHTSWSESSTTSTTDSNGSSSTKTDTTYYSGHEDYIASTTYVVGSEMGLAELTIEPGTQVYNFACQIPPNCPTSYESLHGYIRYTVKVVLIRPWKFDQTFTKGFTVLAIRDLNYEPMALPPVHAIASKTFCCWPCKSSPLQLDIDLPQTGFVPGQNIPVSILVTNDSHIPVEEMKISLAMLVIFYSQCPRSSKTEKTTVAKMKGEGVQRNCKKLFNYQLPVPATPPSNIVSCSILHIMYEVFVEAKIKGFHANQVICAPIIIGNVPLQTVVQQQPTTSFAAQHQMPTAPTDAKMLEAVENNEIAVVSTPIPWEGNGDMQPPTYEEATHMRPGKINADEKHDYGESAFLPRYPVFSIPNPSAPLVKGVPEV
ncbi:arrestin domain-containing protein 2-like [Teleopsis dalmanni]|uniref:arrestin domain-containing protein 2-like n=1 Tax=Teleopsis dalmanni TaxID=139649 RepID=UPI0018CD08A9|nr:arrestin domain-containing protein 2-like [Teleopsis dalmanni]